jgi:hypothetical protein
MLLESLRLAASGQDRGMEWTLESAVEPHLVTARFPVRPDTAPDPLRHYLSMRSVDRRPYRTRKLAARERTQLEQALGPDLEVRWFESAGERWRVAALGARATDIRLRAKETFVVHQRIIDWENRWSPTGLPAGAIGLDPGTLKIMRWAMQSWDRMHRMNRITGTAAAAAQLDFLPGLGSSAFFEILPVPRRAELSVEELIRAGHGLQRFWLTATRLGLAMQPGFAIIIFAHYGRQGTAFTADQSLRDKARKLAEAFVRVFNHDPAETLFIGRIGQPPPRKPGARSVRRPLGELLVSSAPEVPTTP